MATVYKIKKLYDQGTLDYAAVAGVYIKRIAHRSRGERGGVMHELGPGSVSLSQVFRQGDWHWSDYRDFRRIARGCSLVEQVPTTNGYVYALAQRVIGSLGHWLEERSGQSGKHRWEGVKAQHRYTGSATSDEARELMGYKQRNSPYYLKQMGVDTQKKDGHLLFKRKQVEELASGKGTKYIS